MKPNTFVNRTGRIVEKLFRMSDNSALLSTELQDSFYRLQEWSDTRDAPAPKFEEFDKIFQKVSWSLSGLEAQIQDLAYAVDELCQIAEVL